MLRTLSALLAIGVAIMPAGCGSSSGGASSINAQARAQEPTANAQDVAYARAVNLRAADVPRLHQGLRHSKRENTAGLFGGARDRCDGAAAHAGKIIGILSPGFVRSNARREGSAFRDSLLPLEVVRSGVYIFNSEALAYRYLAAGEAPRFAACLQSVAAKEPETVTREGSNVTERVLTDPRVSTLAVSLPGARAYGLRVAVRSSLGAPGAS